MAENESAVTNAAKNLLALNPGQEAEFKKKVQEVKKRPKKRESLVSGVIYVGHLPRGLFEPQLKGYFEQFGTITRLRLSRSKKTGGSKGYAFIEFECDEVAKIVAETMNNYLMGERLIKCEVVAPEKVHARLFVGSQRMFRKPQHPAIRRYNKRHTPAEVEHMTSRLLHKEAQLRKRLAAKGIDYNFPGFASQVQGKRRKMTAEADTSVCSQADTPVCTPSVLEKRKSLKIDDDDDDEEIIIKATPAPKSKGKKKMAAQESGATQQPNVSNGEVSSNGSAGGDQAVQAAGTAQDAQPQQQQQPPPNAWQVIKGVLFRIFIIWAISSWFRRGPSTPDQSTPAGAPRVPSRNLFPKDTLMDLHVYVSQNEIFSDFNNSDALFWSQRDLVYGDWTTGETGDGCYEHYGEMDIPEKVKQNGSLYIHVYFTKSGFHPDPKRKGQYRRLATVHSSRMLNKFKRRKFQKTKNLLTGETEADPEMIKRAESHGPVEVISHWHPNLTINMVDDHTAWVKGSVPPPLDQHVKFDAVSGDYYPIVYFNDYWNLQKDYFPVNETLQKLPLRLSFCPLSLWRWQLYAAQSTKSPWNFLGDDTYEQSDEDQDSVKVALLETNPYLLGLTIVVSIVHSIFEFLAFKNDIQFWNSRQSLEGLSVRSIFFGVFQSLVVLLYILDNETNFVVQVSVFIGLLIDFWKITKVVDVKLDRENRIVGLFPRLTFKDKSTYVQSSTKIYDDMAFRYLSWLLYPLFGCYAVYSLIYMEHKGWYSWVLGMMYGFLLTFGFITMTPQLFINYKMKSVAHLPWRMLTYKALNTFIDDLFAFVIKMPMMYRIGCLRDDVVFFIYLYQRWIYRVDPNRVNEFGTSGVDHVKDSTEQGPAGSEVAAISDKPEGEKKND